MGRSTTTRPLLNIPPGTLIWGVWEYPAGLENMTETDVGDHTVELGGAVMARLPGEQPWLSRPAPPPDPEREALIQGGTPPSPCKISLSSLRRTLGPAMNATVATRPPLPSG
jgi:hypothetical protein